jgi:transposase
MSKKRAVYPSDISREAFEVIRPRLENFRRRTKPKMIDMYDIFCGILYVLTSGCQWRMLPHDFPKWKTVYAYFRQWGAKPSETEASLLERLLDEQVVAHRMREGRKERTSFVIIDAQSVKNANTAEEKGYDAGKKISGIKRHIATDSQGLPHAIGVTAANVSDRAGALMIVRGNQEKLSCVLKILADGGYAGNQFAEAVKMMIGADVEVVKRNELHTFKVIPKRWVVERSFAWLEKYRRLWKNCERLINNSFQMILISFLCLLLKRL